MKKAISVFLLVCMLACMLCTGVLAAAGEEPTVAGIYGITVPSGNPWSSNVSIVPVGTKSDDSWTIDGEDVSDFYPGAEKLTVTVSNPGFVDMFGTEEPYCLLLVLKTDTAMPTADDIVYIDQVLANVDGATFTAYPSKLEKGEYFIYFASNADEITYAEAAGAGNLEKIGSFKSYVPYKLGDVNDDGRITTGDAVDILQYVVGKKTLTEIQLLAGNVDGSGNGVTTGDAVYILQFVVGKPVPYDLKND